jgi:asparagine synthase (glutamine-hydrolysing)
MSMAHSLEVRVPLLDHVFVEQVLRLPGSVKYVSGAPNKPLLRALSPALPERAANRPKMGFTLPFDQWFRGPVKPWLDDIFSRNRGPYSPPLNCNAVASLWQSFLNRSGETTWSRVWCIAALRRWCEVNHVTM